MVQWGRFLHGSETLVVAIGVSIVYPCGLHVCVGICFATGGISQTHKQTGGGHSWPLVIPYRPRIIPPHAL